MDKKRILIIISVVLIGIVAAVGLFFFKKTQPKELAVCNLQNCSSGCCADNICQAKGKEIVGYSCLGANKWQTPEGGMVIGAPKVVEDQIKTEEGVNAIPTPTPIRLSQEQKIEIVENNSKWFDSQKNEKGVYYGSFVVYPDGKDPVKSSDNRVGANVIWAKYQVWKKTSDQSLLDSMRSDFSIQLDDKIVDVYAPDFWSCRIMYELWLDNKLPQDLKDNAEKLCDKGIYEFPRALREPGDATVRLSADVKIAKYEEVDLDSIDFGETPGAVLEYSKRLQMADQLLKYSSYISEFLTKYEWEKVDNYFTIAKAFQNQVLNLYRQLAVENQLVPNECVMGIGFMDLYSATKEDKYLKFAEKLIDANKNKYHDISLFDKVTCAYFIDKMRTLLKRDDYGPIYDNLFSDIYQNHYDQQYKALYEDIHPGKLFKAENNSLLGIILKI